VSAIDVYAADLAYEFDLSLPNARRLADLAIHYLEPTHATDAPDGLADPDVAWAFATGPLGLHACRESVDRVDGFIEEILDAGHDTAGAWFVRGAIAEWRGEIERATAHYAASLERDPAFGPAADAQAFLAFVRGDVMGCRRSPGVGTTSVGREMLHLLDHVEADRPPRNAPCPCGSGRKVKVCCGDGAVDATNEALWLWEKASLWLHRLPQSGRFLAATQEVADLGRDDEERLIHALRLPLVESLVLLDCGLLDAFTASFEPFLRDTELATLEAWKGATHRLWEVRATEPGHTLSLVDLVNGEAIVAMNGDVSRCTGAGELVYAAALPTRDGGWQLPCHPLCLDDEEVEAYVDLLRAGVDPLLVAKALIAEEFDATM
jgi:hypothetical protein